MTQQQYSFFFLNQAKTLLMSLVPGWLDFGDGTLSLPGHICELWKSSGHLRSQLSVPSLGLRALLRTMQVQYLEFSPSEKNSLIFHDFLIFSDTVFWIYEL